MKTTLRDYPVVLHFLTRTGLQTAFILAALILILVYDASIFFFRPYDGLIFGGYDFTVITEVEPGSPAEKGGVLPGDELLLINGNPVDPWLSRPLYPFGIRAGDSVTYEIRRLDQTLSLQVKVAGFFASPSFFIPLLGLLILSLAFWAIGFCLCIFTPHDHVPARLAGLIWLLTGVAVATGGPAGESYFWGSGITMKLTWAVLGFLLVSLHTLFPTAVVSSSNRNRLMGLFAAIAVGLIAVTIVDDAVIKPYLHAYTGLAMLVYGFFFLSVLVSLGLLLRGYSRAADPDFRRQTGIVLWGMGLGFLPFLLLTLLPIFLRLDFIPGGYTSLFLVLIPLAYAYVILQRKLLKVDFIINRLAVFFVVGLLVLIATFLALVLFSAVVDFPKVVPVTGSIVAVLVALPSASLREKANRWVSQALYGASYDHASVTGSLSNRLAQALDRRTLVDLLTVDLARQMGIQQAALMLLGDDRLRVWQQPGNGGGPISPDDEVCKRLLQSRYPVRQQHLLHLVSPGAGENWSQFSWGELFAPLIFENRLLGVLVLGPRVAGDVYADQDVRIVATVADQGALAFANIQLVEALRGLSQQLVRAGENERKQVVRDLHDGVLQNLFFIRQIISKESEAVKHLSDVITTLRGILKTQRPLILDLGLAPALEDLVLNMKSLAGPQGPHIEWGNQTENLHLPDEEATAIYRVAQESLANALRHAQAANILVFLEREGDNLLLTIEDDGVGMPPNPTAEGQFGLLGMRERAYMIGAKLNITSTSGKGTKIQMEYRLC